jgi:long-chain acyl-CoA synthetase
VLSYLPLCHVAERLISLITALGYGYVVNFPESATTMAADIVEIQPTFFLGVPRVWEKLMASTEIRMQDASYLKRRTYRFFMAQGKRTAARRLAGGRPGLGYAVGWLFVYRHLRRKMGLARVRGAISGAAPIAPQVLEWFWALGVTVREGYGQTEGTGLGTVNPPGRVKMGSVGRALPAVELRIADDGEILLRSPGVFPGYFKNPDATAATVDPDGWLHSGDVGTLDADGYLTITDRKKDIIITAGGKNISPSEIENKLKVSPYIREAVVIGDRRPYLTALLGIELDTVRNWATRQNLAFTTYADLSAKPEVRALLQEWVDHVNTELAQVETIKRFAMILRELDHEEGELTATQKVKRAAITKMFEAEIEALYRSKA